MRSLVDVSMAANQTEKSHAVADASTLAVRQLTPQRFFCMLKLPYHYALAFLGALWYRFPSRKINVVAVTGTKGKSSVVELVSALLEEALRKTAHASTIHFKIGDKKERNLHKMTMPGRFFLQGFLRKAIKAGCTHAVLEMTSEGARQFRHKFIALDGLIFTNLAPEHIESHGSYENYVAAKVSIAEALETSKVKSLSHLIPPFRQLADKGVAESARAEDLTTPQSPPSPTTPPRRLGTPPRAGGVGGEEIPPASRPPFSPPDGEGRISQKLLVVNGDDKEAQKFLDAFSGTKIVYSKQDAKNSRVTSEGISFMWQGVRIESKLPGEFNLYNILAAITYAGAAGIPIEKIKAGIWNVQSIKGRAEKITLDTPTTPESPPQEPLRLADSALPLRKGAVGGEERKQDFEIIVDYAHTPDSLEKLYQTYAGKYRRCILGNTGGGRDAWKRPVMAGIAEKYCDEITLTNEDPYDEDPEKIIREMAAGMKYKEPLLVLDRRKAIRNVLERSSKGDVVLITGKGTDPYIMGRHGTKESWDDATVVKEELQKILSQRNF